MSPVIKNIIAAIIASFLLIPAAGCNNKSSEVADEQTPQAESVYDLNKPVYKVVEIPTPNVGEGINRVSGIVLHHTAEPTAESALAKLTASGSGVSAHVLIDTDGTRYILADPEAITWHAGKSRLNGRENANNFTVGIEFQGNTVDTPLTDAQIASAVEYIRPLISQYDIPLKNIVTHEYIRTEYKRAHPGDKVPDKVDVQSVERDRLIRALEENKKASVPTGTDAIQ